MLTSYYTVHLLSRALDRALCGKTISGAYTQAKNQLVVEFGDSRPALVVICLPRNAIFYLQPRHGRAKRNVTDVLPLLTGNIVKAVAAHPGDRVAIFSFSGGLRMAVLCYGSSPNVLIIDGADRVVDAFLDAKNLVGTSYHPRSGPQEELPDLGEVDRAIDAAPDLALQVVLRRAYPRLGEILTREVLHRAGIDPHTKGADAKQRSRIQAGLVAVHGALADPHPVVYVRGARQTPVALSLIPLHHLAELAALPFDDIHEAVRMFLSRRHAAGHFDDERQSIVATLDRNIVKTRRTIAAVTQDLAEGDRAAEYERFGKLLLPNLGSVSRGDRSVTLQDPEGPWTIPLDPRLSPADNAQKYFAKSKSARTARREAASRLEELRRDESAALALRAALEETETGEALQALLEERGEEFSAFGIHSKKATHAVPPPFRIFTVDGGFQVWAGKNSSNNDELTLRHTRPNDLWFHVRGGGGAHVVLKTGSGRGEPGRKAKEQAAGIAAWYSKMKNARMVPVAVTLRKYVRKPKGAPPGTVTIEREDVIFAEPRLPDGDQGLPSERRQ
jgi:predicted ribosome quality control (RQC) complex YloA/Tae2 family protein